MTIGPGFWTFPEAFTAVFGWTFSFGAALAEEGLGLKIEMIAVEWYISSRRY